MNRADKLSESERQQFDEWVRRANPRTVEPIPTHDRQCDVPNNMGVITCSVACLSRSADDRINQKVALWHESHR